MGWFNKKKEERRLGDIPELPELPEMDDLDYPYNDDVSETYPSSFKSSEKNFKPEVSSLPSLPSSEFPENFNQSMIKSEITKKQEVQPSKFKPFQDFEEPKEQEHYIPPVSNTAHHTQSKTQEPIYIRLDNFNASNQMFNEIKNKISEIEHLLKKTKEIKEKENKELEEWEKEIQLIKMRLESIDKNIFNKFD